MSLRTVFSVCQPSLHNAAIQLGFETWQTGCNMVHATLCADAFVTISMLSLCALIWEVLTCQQKILQASGLRFCACLTDLTAAASSGIDRQADSCRQSTLLCKGSLLFWEPWQQAPACSNLQQLQCKRGPQGPAGCFVRSARQHNNALPVLLRCCTTSAYANS